MLGLKLIHNSKRAPGVLLDRKLVFFLNTHGFGIFIYITNTKPHRVFIVNGNIKNYTSIC